jgi:hypothetical protein
MFGVISRKPRIFSKAAAMRWEAWPADFILDHTKKIALLNGVGCPAEALPHIGGQLYLWQEFVLRRADGTICVAAVDRAHETAKYQTRTLAQRYASVLEHLPSLPLNAVTSCTGNGWPSPVLLPTTRFSPIG